MYDISMIDKILNIYLWYFVNIFLEIYITIYLANSRYILVPVTGSRRVNSVVRGKPLGVNKNMITTI